MNGEDYVELSKSQLREQLIYDVDQYLKNGGTIKVYDVAGNQVSEYNSEEEQ